jgi:PPOX class probable F420-dependent enzyme
MDAAAARTFLAANPRAVLSTLRRDGRPQLSPVLCTVDDAGRVVVSTREDSVKVRNLRRDPRVALCAFTDRFFGQWVQVEGEAELVSLPEAMDVLVDYYRRISGEHPDWADYRAAMERERRVVVRFAITRAGPGAAG